MCGIAGLITKSDADSPREMAARMTAAMGHRGPDDQGVHESGAMALGHARLSIIDLGGGHQPLFNEDGSIAVVFNGEIYNFPELADQLKARGHTFRTRSDTEVLVHLYEEVGDDLVSFLRGMFAFAIWDARRQRLLLARDRFGIKPLYTYDDGRRFLFASELKAIVAASPLVDRTIDDEALRLYFSLGYIPAPHAIYRRCRKLLPGHTMVLEEGKEPRARRYWDLRTITTDPHIREEDAIDRLDALVRDAVKVRLVADVPLGAFLSGGTDSSLVVAAMAAQMDRPVQTFCIGFGEAEFNEAPYAQAVARHLGTEHREEILRPDVVALVDRVLHHLDEPFADSSAIPTLCVAEMTRRHVTVALSGDGGDELFGGYGRYVRQRAIEWASVLPRRALTATASVLGHIGATGVGFRARRLFERAALPFPDRYANGLLFFPDEVEKAGLLAEPYVPNTTALDLLRGLGLTRGGVGECQRIDALLYLPDDILTKVDRMTMAVSLEARVPLLDHHLAEYAFSLPPDLGLKGVESKHVLKKLLLRYLPAGLVYRKKQGFAVPLRTWFRSELHEMLRDVLLSDRCLQRGVLRREGIEHLLDTHDAGHRDLSPQLWSLLVFETWMRQHEH